MKKVLSILTLIFLITNFMPLPTLAEGGLYDDITTGSLKTVSGDGDVLELPLKHTAVKAEIDGSIAQVVVEQEFHNPFSDPIEAIYVFPLPEDAAVDQMEMHIGDKIVKAVIKTSEEARQTYEEAKRQGQRTALLEQERPNIFTQSVANIMPGDQITIQIRYFQVLPYKNGKYTFRFPVVVGPRYIPAGGVPDANRITPPPVPKGYRSGHDISLKIDLNTQGLVMTNLNSVNHEVSINQQANDHAVIKNLAQDAIPNKDFVLKYQIAGDAPSFTILSHKTDDKDGYLTMLALPPISPAAETITPKELFFVVDTSGSTF